MQALYADFKGRLAKYGRGPDDLKILSGVTIIVGETAQRAEDVAGEFDDLVPPPVGADYLSKTVGRSMKDHPLDGPMAEFEKEHVGHTGIGRAIVKVAKEQGLTVRQTYRRILPQMAGNMFNGDAQQVAD